MNISPPPGSLGAPLPDPGPQVPREPRLRRLTNWLLGKGITLVLAGFAHGAGGRRPSWCSPARCRGRTPSSRCILSNLTVLLLLGAVLAGRLTRVWVERRRGSAGSRLHVRLVLLFSVVAVTPAIVVAVFATVFFNLGIQAWFNDRVRTALQESLQASRGYLEEHRNNIRTDALGMANDLARAGYLLTDDPNAFGDSAGRPDRAARPDRGDHLRAGHGEVLASAGLMAGLGADPPPTWAVDLARSGDVAVLGSGGFDARCAPWCSWTRRRR